MKNGDERIHSEEMCHVYNHEADALRNRVRELEVKLARLKAKMKKQSKRGAEIQPKRKLVAVAR